MSVTSPKCCGLWLTPIKIFCGHNKMTVLYMHLNEMKISGKSQYITLNKSSIRSSYTYPCLALVRIIGKVLCHSELQSFKWTWFGIIFKFNFNQTKVRMLMVAPIRSFLFFVFFLLWQRNAHNNEHNEDRYYVYCMTVTLCVYKYSWFGICWVYFVD